MTVLIPTSWATAADSDPKERFIHHAAGVTGSGSSSYIDDVILRDRDNSGGAGWLTTSDGTLEERFFHLHNWRHDVIALGKTDGVLVERVKYSAYGVATRLDPADYNGDSFLDFFDDDDFDLDHTNNNAKADFDYNGTVNATDSTAWTAAYTTGSNSARGVLSTTNATMGVNNRAGYAGYQFSPATQQYHVRHRVLDPNVGLWDERDPMGYHDGANLYMYVNDNPVNGRDSMGLRREPGGCMTGCQDLYMSSSSDGEPNLLPMSCDYPVERTFQACRDWASCILTRRRTPRGTCFDSAVDAAANCCWAGFDNSMSTCLRSLNDQYFACGNSPDPCFRVAPMEPTSEICDFYRECETYRLANARCFCL
ncbi:MAG TPA: RHS repeat-associated core domain-containing protein, partial [Candidatus Hydrogenedentes bacterium]|nr:RHS repeat-associated core domain-containing protein [Candidatus Hydrogenedentota bacterium]